jgi:acetyltransferase-like isoleucine patch superfamily enzyme
MKQVKRIIYKWIARIGKVLLLLDKLLKTHYYRNIYQWHLRKLGAEIGERVEIGSNFDVDVSEKVAIGNDTIISFRVTILTHDYSLGKALSFKEGKQLDMAIVKPVSIGNNCFIGANSTLLPGTTIGDNVIIGAGTVVRGKIPDNVVVAGNPCKIMKTIDEHYETQKKYNKKYFKMHL